MNRPPVIPPRPWHFPVPRVDRLANGMDVQVFERTGQHLIAATLVLDQPLNCEPSGLDGVAAIVQRCLDEGTATHPGTSFAEHLEGLGAVLTGGTSHAAAHVSLEVPGTRFADALPLFAEALLEPSLDESDVRRHVDLRLAEIVQHRAHPSHRGGQAFREAVIAPEFRASRPTAGSADTVAGITTEAVRTHHATHYGPARATLILAGDFGADPMPLVHRAFGDWATPVTHVGHETPAAAAPRGLLIHRPGAVQADVRLGTFGLDRRDAGWPALRLGAFVLGGGFLSRLNRVLREQRGYTYGVQLANTPARSGGLLAMHASFRTEVAAAAVAEALELIRVDGTHALTAAELADARNFLVGVTPLRCATAAGITDQVAALVEAGLDAAWLDGHLAALSRVTPDEATAVLGRLLPREGLTVVVVGDADVLAAPLAAAGVAVDVVTDSD